MMQVPLLDLRRDTEDLDPLLEDAFRRVLRSGHYILGAEVEGLEAECARYLGIDTSIGVSSGTDALILALMALGVGPGDEVVCPTYTFFATAGAIARLGARPVFVDVDPHTYNADDSERWASRVTARTKAFVPVHLFGQSTDMGKLLEVARAKNIPIIEDAAQSLGADWNGRRSGTIGDFGCYSFFPSKNLGAFGDAGLLVARTGELDQRARLLRAHGAQPKYHHKLVGGNFRIDALQAALLRVKLPRLEAATARRQANAARYDAAFRANGAIERGLELPRAAPGNRHIFNQYVIRLRGDGARDRLMQHLKQNGVGCEVYYPVPMHQQECFSALGYRRGEFPHSEAAARETLAIPIFPELREDELDYVAETIHRFVR